MTSNAIKRAIAEDTRARGVFMTFPAPSVIEALSALKLDFIYIDGEHGCFDWSDIERMCIAADLHGMTPIARIPDGSAATITHFLDRGVKGIIVPHVESVSDAKAIVEAAYFAPIGQRSFGGGRPTFVHGISDKKAHLAACNAATTVSVMIESGAGLEAAADIAALDGIDFMSFGLWDLAQSLGYPGEPDHPKVRKAVERASQAVRAAGTQIREDILNYAWINDVIVSGAKALLDKERGTGGRGGARS